MLHQKLIQQSISNNTSSQQNKNKLILQFNDPNWLHVYWEVTEEKIEDFVNHFDTNEVKDFSWALRIIPNKPRHENNNDIFIIIGIEEQSKYIYIQHPRTTDNKVKEFYCEYGLLSLDYVFFPLLRSNIVMMPTWSQDTYNSLSSNNLSHNNKNAFTIVNNYLSNSRTSSEVYYDYTQTSHSS